MSRGTFQTSASLLAGYEGRMLYTAPEAMLKGLLEAETAVSTLAGPLGEPFGELFRLVHDESVAEVIRSHEMSVTATATAARAITLARNTARDARHAWVLVPNNQLMSSAAALRRVAREPLQRGGALALLLEDRPHHAPESGPRRLARQIDLPCLEAVDATELRDGMEITVRLSRASGRPIALVVHASVLRAADTIEARPNRVIESVDALLARRRRRRPRLTETADVLRLMRRLEFNRAGGLPNPGERVPVGFIAVGPAVGALQHVLHARRLIGRVPLLRLGVPHPVDPVTVSRLLGRCERVIVLEPRPGEIEEAVLEVAEGMRRQGERPGVVWGPEVPSNAGEPIPVAADDAAHPSLLALRIAHLLDLARVSRRAPVLAVAGELPSDVPERGAAVGPAAAVAVVRRIAAEADQWLRDQPAGEGDEAMELRTALSIDGSRPAAGLERQVVLETWDPDRFREEGVSALRQAARDDRPWITIVCAVGGEDARDLERMARGAIPGERADRVHFESGNLSDTTGLVELICESALLDRMTVLVVRDGPPARFDVAQLERAASEIDRLGFEPRHRVTWPVDRACAVRQPLQEEVPGPRGGIELARPRLRVDRVPRGSGRRSFAIRPRLEQVEVIRTRPPARRRGAGPAARLTPPELVHRTAAMWRAHLAGFRGSAPGLAARTLCEAGRLMGYAVQSVYDPTPVGAARRAWAQVVFTRPREGEQALVLSPRIPFGEADLVVGLDLVETHRAFVSDPCLCVASGDRTYAVLNLGSPSDEGDTEAAGQVREQLRSVIREATRPEPRLSEDFADACRARFHTDRVVDLALLGAAFQSGLIPVTVGAIETAVAGAETAGFGRATEAFRFGRQLAFDPGLFSGPREHREEDVGQILRRTTRRLRRAGRRSASAGRLADELEAGLERMPGLTETDAGRHARRDFVIAVSRCFLWGGVDYARQYIRLVTGLYDVDRGDTGRSLTRNAILPLAGAMLIRDPIFVATMTTSAEHRLRTRQTLNVKHARGDELVRRYLTRLEITVLHRRCRADVRTSDWSVGLVAAARFLVPRRWRGNRREREIRAYVLELVERAAREADQAYEYFQNAFARLHQQAAAHRLRTLAMAEARMLVEGGEESDEARRSDQGGTSPGIAVAP